MKDKSYTVLLVLALIAALGWIFRKDKIIEYLDRQGIKITDPNNPSPIDQQPSNQNAIIQDTLSPGPLDWVKIFGSEKATKNDYEGYSGGVAGGIYKDGKLIEPAKPNNSGTGMSPNPNDPNIIATKDLILNSDPTKEYVQAPVIDKTLKQSTAPENDINTVVNPQTEVIVNPVTNTPALGYDPTNKLATAKLILKISAISKAERRPMNKQEVTDINNIANGRPVQYFTNFL